MEPNISPPSNAINIVPAPTPLLSMCDKSAVHANNVGLEIPVAHPKIMAAKVYELIVVDKPINNIAVIKNRFPMRRVFLRPILSESEPENKRIRIVEMT